jgi:hypothetical protein
VIDGGKRDPKGIEGGMKDMVREANRTGGGPRRRRHYSFNESVDEPAALIEDEPTDIQAATPLDENEPVERIDESNPAERPDFDGGVDHATSKKD